jgi:hypothetical protein
VGGSEIVLLWLNWIDLPMGYSREATVTPTKNMKKRNPHIGSNFDDFLKEDGIFEEVQAKALKRALAEQIQESMNAAKISKVKMRWSQDG